MPYFGDDVIKKATKGYNYVFGAQTKPLQPAVKLHLGARRSTDKRNPKEPKMPVKPTREM